jgi:hypothetical protein
MPKVSRPLHVRPANYQGTSYRPCHGEFVSPTGADELTVMLWLGCGTPPPARSAARRRQRAIEHDLRAAKPRPLQKREMMNGFELGGLRAGGEELEGGRQFINGQSGERLNRSPNRGRRLRQAESRFDLVGGTRSVRLVRLRLRCLPRPNGQTRNPDIETIRAQTRERVRKYRQRRTAIT